MSLARIAVAATLLVAPSLHADVITVAQDGSGDFTLVSAAIASAVDGDVILIAPANYVPFFPQAPDSALAVENKTLTLVGDGDGVILPPLFVRNLPASKRFVLSNVSVSWGQLSGIIVPGINVVNCVGEVVIEDCYVQGRAGGTAIPKALAALDVSGHSTVIAARTTFVGGLGPDAQVGFPFPSTSEGGDAVVVHAGAVAFHHCTLIGGKGSDDPSATQGGRPGGDGLVVSNASVRVLGSEVVGGQGGSPCPVEMPENCVGGDGAVVTNALLQSVGSSYAGGAGGLLDDLSPAPDGTPVSLANATHLDYPDGVPDLLGPAVAREGELVTLSVLGEPGLGVRLFLSLDTAYAPLSGKKGVFIPAAPALGPLVLGTMPAGGQFDVAFVMPDLVGLEHVSTCWQGYTTDGSSFVLSSPLVLELVDSAF